jgi:hypothetical protein
MTPKQKSKTRSIEVEKRIRDIILANKMSGELNAEIISKQIVNELLYKKR